MLTDVCNYVAVCNLLGDEETNPNSAHRNNVNSALSLPF